MKNSISRCSRCFKYFFQDAQALSELHWDVFPSSILLLQWQRTSGFCFADASVERGDYGSDLSSESVAVRDTARGSGLQLL